ncbi:MAG: Nif11-like leader peptide family natural product precursor [Syntrophales bacterium]|nr:Nif11-like leader peptide family natural product precursor [Syntrophales bacterium]MDD5640214.1 Nif11-like leader peptide family natural product precursor [Syntrophales bacterium]
MSIQSARDFLQKIENDKPLQDRLEAAPGLEARQKIVIAAGFDFTLKEFKQAVDELAKAAGRELTPQELGEIWGGSGRAGWGCKHCDWHCSPVCAFHNW